MKCLRHPTSLPRSCMHYEGKFENYLQDCVEPMTERYFYVPRSHLMTLFS